MCLQYGANMAVNQAGRAARLVLVLYQNDQTMNIVYPRCPLPARPWSANSQQMQPPLSFVSSFLHLVIVLEAGGKRACRVCR